MNDADIQMAHLTEIAKRSERLKGRGICTHGWVKGDAPSTCLECGKTFKTFNDLLDERNDRLN
jgi:hypothetical protein